MPVKMIYRLRDRAWGGRLKDLRFVSAQKRQSRGRSWRQGASFTGEPGPQAGSMKSPWGVQTSLLQGAVSPLQNIFPPHAPPPCGPSNLKTELWKEA